MILSVGSLVGTGVLESIDLIGRDRFEIIGLNSDPSAINNFRCDVCYVSSPTAERAALIAQLDALAAQHPPDLVIPGRDDDVVVLAHWRAQRPELAIMVGSVAMAEIIRDKWASYEWARANALPFARSAIDAPTLTALHRDVGLPLVAKPRLGFGSNGVRILMTPEHVNAALKRTDTIVQEAIDPSPTLAPDALAEGVPLWFAPVQPGSPLGISLLDDAGCRFISTTCSRHVRGSAIDTMLLDDAALKDVLMRYSEVAWRDGWRGLFSIQARRNAAGEHIVIELAGRFMGATSALAVLGVPVFERVLETYIPDYRATLPQRPNFHLRVVKQIASRALDTRDEATLRSTGQWRAP